MLAQLALAGIRGYQRHLSPLKGYGCAYRLAHGGTGCSGFAKGVIAEVGLIAALPAIRQRLRDCHAAALAFRQSDGPEDNQPPQRRRWFHGCDCSGCSDFRLCAPARSQADTSCDATPACTPDCCGG